MEKMIWKMNLEVNGEIETKYFGTTKEMCEFTINNPIGSCTIFHIIPPTILPDTAEIIGWEEVLKNCGEIK